MYRSPRLTLFLQFALAALFSATVIFSGVILTLLPGLPPVQQLRDTRLQIPLRVFSAEGLLLGEFGEQRRTLIGYDQIPEKLVLAFLAAEDDNFFSHSGVDLFGLLRAASQIVTSGEIQSGGSTITMQVARNFFLSREQSFVRKFNEILLAYMIERELTKKEILELYANKIYLGKRAYGIEAAANVYYGVGVHDLDLSQMAMIAGLPKAPSAYNPVNDPERAMERRDWILGRMLKLGYIDVTEYLAAVAQPLTARDHGPSLALDAPDIAEMARDEVVSRFGQAAYEAGYEVYTTVRVDLQRAAVQSLRAGLMLYDQRHGYRGPEQQLDLAALTPEEVEAQLAAIPVVGDLVPALVQAVAEQSLQLRLKDGEITTLGWDQGLSTLQPYLSVNAVGPRPTSAAEIFSAGDVIRIQKDGDPANWRLAQIPEIQGALISLNTSDGAILALVGGFDFNYSKFNRAIQARRQPGSNIKPFIYATAFEHGFTPASIINDAPIVIEDAATEGFWRPQNDSGEFYGPTRLRKGLYLSRNLVAIRLLQALGIDTAREGIKRFGFVDAELAENLTLALGSQGVPPIKLAAGYATFANGGFRVDPYLVERILDSEGNVVYRANPATVCDGTCQPRPAPSRIAAGTDVTIADAENPALLVAATGIEPAPRPAEQIIDPRVAYIMDSILKDVIKLGTGRRAQDLQRGDVAGKTGTTNGPTDAWFTGYNPDISTTAWVGFDDNRYLGNTEFGGTSALPIWIEFMRAALAGKPEKMLRQPDGIVTARINPDTGERAAPGDPDAIFELFLRENSPAATSVETRPAGGRDSPATIDLF